MVDIPTVTTPEEEAMARAAIYFWTHPRGALNEVPEKEWLQGLVRVIRQCEIPEVEMSLEHLDLATFDIDLYRETYEAMYEKEIGHRSPQEPFWYIPYKVPNAVMVKMSSEPPGPGSILAEGPPPPCKELVGLTFRRKS